MADYMDRCGIRIFPAAIEFYGIDSGKIYRELVTVRNVSKVSKNIRFYPAKSEKFVLKVKNPTRPVAPGLQVQALVEYETEHVTTVEDRLIVSVDGDPVEIPIRVDAAKPMLSFEPHVDFGSVVAVTKVHSREVIISNRGDKAGDFNITYHGEWPINILPMNGTVPAKTAQVVKVEYVTKSPGKFTEFAMIELEGRPEPLPLHMRGVVVERKLELLSLADESPVHCIRFGNNYYGTDRTETGILFNNSPEPVSFVAVVKDDAVGQELGMLDASAKDPANCLTQVISAIPNQGTLPPYAKVPIFFRFSPRWSGIKKGWRSDHRSTIAPRQDFALFVHLELVGATSQTQGSFLEIALTGTALPVEMTLSPLNLEFGSCHINDHVDKVCTLTNESPSLPLEFNLRRIAHYTVTPQSGKLAPGATEKLFFAFNPKQIGTFSQCQQIDVLGPVADDYSYNMSKSAVIHTLRVKLQGQSLLKTVTKGPIYNHGITPKISNEVGINADTTFSEAKLLKAPRAAVLESLNTYHYNKENVGKDLVAFPNDRACSIRPSKKDTTYRTILTKEERYNYTDPDYAFTDAEQEARTRHLAQYTGFLEGRRENRAQKVKALKWADNENDVDIGIVPNAGIKPPTLKLDEIKNEQPANLLEPEYRVMSSKEFAKMKESNAGKPVCEGLNALPTKREEILDCQRLLSPQELHQVVIGPPTIEFGDVCLRSVCTRDLSIVNNLNQFVHVVVNADCRELRQSSPLSQVIPPCSKAIVPIIFESNTKGLFQRSLTYSVNSHYKHHVTVTAHVVQVSLEIEPDEIQVVASPGQPVDAGYRGVVTLRNPLNHPADFTWEPVLGDRGTAFSIRPASGTVDAEKSLDCEVVFHPSYLAPEDGLFSLHVQGGKSSKLKCTAKFGPVNVDFAESRIMFDSTPLHLTTTKAALINNRGHNHAFFEVVDTNPFPGMTIGPKHGHVPIGGNAELQISLTPSAVIKFDTRVTVNIRGWKTIELRIGGTVCPPSLDIDVGTFNLGGVHCGSHRVMPFNLKNVTPSKARVEVDLGRYPDFSLVIPSMDTSEILVNPGLWMLDLAGDEILPCQLHFNPTEVASYDFHLPVVINDTGAPSPAPSSYPATPAASEKNSVQPIIRKQTIAYQVATPRRRVIATALRQPLQISHDRLEFTLPVGCTHDQTAAAAQKQIILVNNSEKRLTWAVDMNRFDRVMEAGVFRFMHASGVPFLTHDDGGIEGTLDPGITCTLGVVFDPAAPGLYETRVPIVIDDQFSHPYCYLSLCGELKQPEIWFDPMSIVLTPAPLKTVVSAELTIVATNFQTATRLRVECPEVECLDGSRVSPISVTWPNGDTILASATEDEPCPLVCQVFFSSSRPVSFTSPLVFVDSSDRRYELMVTASADNCVMTSYPFIAQHRADHHIVREQQTTLKNDSPDGELVEVSEAVYKPTQSPVRPLSRPSTSATSSEFQVSSSSYEGSKSITDSTLPSTPREGALVKLLQSHSDQSQTRADLASRSLGSVIFPDEDSDEGIFHSEVVLACQRWFSSNGWPGGLTPISLPTTLRRNGRSGTSDEPMDKKTKSGREVNNRKKEKKSVFDMIAHLLGRPVPGIPVNAPSGEASEQIKQIYWQHDAMIVFLRSQGGCLASVRPEFLMDVEEYRYWYKVQSELKLKKQNDDLTKLRPQENLMDKELFDVVSKRAWTDTLLQILKTLVLSKITPSSLKTYCITEPGLDIPQINKEPLSSNVYSTGERVLLAWLNHCYSNFRSKVWRTSQNGGVPAARWIVNFDYDLLDGLVLGSVLGAYCPSVVETHLKHMYTKPATPEQCLHNALKVVNAIEFIGIQYDIQAIDITDPNPIGLMLLCVSLYQHMHQYLPKSRVDFQGALHSTVTRQVRLSNPSGKPLHYSAMIVGQDARDFSMPKGGDVTVAPRGHSSVNVEFTSRFRRPAEAMLLLVGRKNGSATGSTVVFELKSNMSDVKPREDGGLRVIKMESPCYELLQTRIDVTNPFEVAGKFRAILMDTDTANKGGRVDEGTKGKTSKMNLDVMVTKSNTPDCRMEAFFMSEQVLDLSSGGKDFVTLDFLPFDIGKRQCYILFVSEEAGEFMYQIEANGLLPRPTAVEFVPSPSGARIIGPPTQDEDEQNIIYWKCPVKTVLKEEVALPLVNAQREEALLMASQKLMSEDEFRRRDVTGTLASDMLMSKTLGLLSGQAEVKPGNVKRRPVKMYEVMCDSTFFKAPENVRIAQPLRSSEDKDATYKLTVEFSAESAGHYPCRLIVRGPDDVRVYRLECFASADGDQATIRFKCPVNQSSTQNIPIINTTNRDWQMRAHIEAEGFYGPNMILVNAGQTCPYPLMFKPLLDREVVGKLKLRNTTEKTDQVFNIVGKATPALALDTVHLQCTVGERMVHTLKVPNLTPRKLRYEVQSDVDVIHGDSHVTVWPGQVADYDVIVTPLRRGNMKGVITFTSGRSNQVEVDSDGEEVEETPGAEERHQVWMNIELDVTAAQPLTTLDIHCACQNTSVLQIPMTNPTQSELELEVQLDGRYVSGAESLTIPPRGKGHYELYYQPALMGHYKGGVVFYHELIGEVWYELNLVADPPKPMILKDMICELGKRTSQEIVLKNTTEGTLKLLPRLTDDVNFSLDLDVDTVIVRPNDSYKVPLIYCPSTIGPEEQNTDVIFTSDKIGEWRFSVRGFGEAPGRQETVSVFTQVGCNTNLLIPFRNPLNTAVYLDIKLTDKNMNHDDFFSNELHSPDQPFCLVLKQTRRVRVKSGSILDVPVSFSPGEMREYEAACVVDVTPCEGRTWAYDAQFDPNSACLPSSIADGRVSSFRWVWPVRGVAEVNSDSAAAAVVVCQARNRVEETVQVTLTGVPSSLLNSRNIATPTSDRPRSGRSSTSPTSDLTYELVYDPRLPDHDKLRNAVAIKLLSQDADTTRSSLKLRFSVVFAPSTVLRQTIPLVVRAISGGVWRFLLTFAAEDPEPDDVIELEAVGLNKTCAVGFRLNSQDSDPVRFEAYFDPSSDSEMTVSPRRGELLPASAGGTLFTVSFTPNMYGKIFRGRLIVKTADMQWIYIVRGVPPNYTPPAGHPTSPTRGFPDPRHRNQGYNFPRKNLKLATTAISSPIKGAPILLSNQKIA